MTSVPKVYKDNVAKYLYYLADYDYQKRVWKDGKAMPGDMSLSFVESICMVFDDTGLGDALDVGEIVFDMAADQAIKDLLNTIDATHRNMPDRLFIDTLAMQNIREKATRALQLILQSSTNDYQH